MSVGLDGWDGMVIIGHRSSKSTFSANKDGGGFPRYTKNETFFFGQTNVQIGTFWKALPRAEMMIIHHLHLDQAAQPVIDLPSCSPGWSFLERNLLARQITASTSFLTFFHCEGTIYKFNSVYNNHHLMCFCMIDVFNCFCIATNIDKSIKRCCRNDTTDWLSWQCAVGIMQLSCEIQLLEAPLVLLPCTAVAFFDLLNHPLHCIGGSGHGYHSKTTNKGSHTIPCFHTHASRH